MKNKINRVEIYVATHKTYSFPSQNEYVPIHVGKKLSDIDLGIQGDDTGENISNLNPNFCELTALYWMWKNSSADVIGLVHYRRYFINQSEFTQSNLTKKHAAYNMAEKVNFEPLDPKMVSTLPKNTVILAQLETFPINNVSKYSFLNHLFFKRKNLFTVEAQFCSCHHPDDWFFLKQLIAKRSPEYLRAFNTISKRKSGISPYNMFIMHKTLMDEYAEWLFDILLSFFYQKDICHYDSYQKRLFGFLAERLLNVFIEKNKKILQVKYLPVFNK